MWICAFSPHPKPSAPSVPRLTGEVSQNEGGASKSANLLESSPSPLMGARGRGMGVSIACPRD